ncbi:hypothetical protein QCA50_015091 [Cerrena zonata]|uniref:Uncharacterized protein n=1 Tax=Cerrena zonata TaxID=2478898 RepID=A0AAW0FU13_9APHY
MATQLIHSSKRPNWYSDFKHVVWQEHCLLVSNCPYPLDVPPGNGVEMLEGKPFHLSLLTRAHWSDDKFWYLGMLPRHPTLFHDPLFNSLSIPFDRLPIEETPDQLYVLKTSISDVWQQLQYLTVQSYNQLKERYLPLVPLATTMPPYPQAAGFRDKHSTELAARKASHRARRLFLPWLCLLACTIAAATRSQDSTPPQWFQILATSDVEFPAFWLDKITGSNFLTQFSPLVPRRGMVYNMTIEWGFWSVYPLLRVANLPISLCFPHGSQIPYKLGRGLFPNGDKIQQARTVFDNLCQAYNAAGSAGDLVSSIACPDSVLPSPHAAEVIEEGGATTSTDALTAFFRQRKIDRDRHEVTHTGRQHLSANHRLAGERLLSKSGLYEWIALECYPWYERQRVPRWDREEVWASYTANQRLYDDVADEWDCVADFAPLESVYCTIVGCRDGTHDHDDDDLQVALTNMNRSGELPEMRNCRPNELHALTFTRAHMDPFMDVLRYRYGLNIPASRDATVVTMDSVTKLAVLKGLRSMVQEEAVNDFSWQTAEALASVVELSNASDNYEMVPTSLSDCHLPDAEFLHNHNVWGFTQSVGRLIDIPVRLYVIKTINSAALNWLIAVHSRTTWREILRRRWGPGNAQVCRALMERGIAFKKLWKKGVPLTELQSHLVKPIYRWDRWTFTTADYRSYVERRLHLLRNLAVCSAALQSGGILWRLTMESTVDIDKVTSAANADEALTLRTVNVGNSVLLSNCISPEVGESIVGMYKIFTGIGEQTTDVSWWPKENTWNASGFNCGHWTTQCEEWYRRRCEAIAAGVAFPRKPKEWQSALKLWLTPMKNLRRNMEREL